MRQRFTPGLSLFAMALMVPLSLLVMNLSDQPLRPEVQKILDAPEPTVGDAARGAYAFMLGMLAGERTSPESVGTKILAELDSAHLPTKPNESPWHVDFDHCGGSTPVPCWIDQLNADTRKAVRDNEPILKLYLRLMEYGDYAALGRPRAGRIFDPVSMPPPALHRLFTLKLASWVEAGGQERAWAALESSTRFYAAAFRRGDTLLTRMIALVELDTNARVIQAEMARRPRWSPPAALIDAFSLPDSNDVLGAALEDETRIVYQMIQGLRSDWRRWFLRPNETINRFYDLDAQVFFTDCRQANPVCVPALEQLDRGLRRYLVNQVGETLLRTVVVDFNVREKMLKRMQNILELKDAFRRRL